VQAPLLRFEHELHSWVSFLIMPLFALANAGVRVVGDTPPLFQPAAMGTALGLVLGKPIGITLFSWLAVKLGAASLPDNVQWLHIHGAGWLAGIGFTMALFVGELAFQTGPQLAAVKVAIVGASLAAGLIGAALLLRIPLPAIPAAPIPSATAPQPSTTL
jgi:NhaA family Na+:H+ antiporter